MFLSDDKDKKKKIMIKVCFKSNNSIFYFKSKLLIKTYLKCCSSIVFSSFVLENDWQQRYRLVSSHKE